MESMEIFSLEEPVPFETDLYHGSIEWIAENALIGWIAGKGGRPAVLRITAVGARGSVTAINREARPDVAVALGCDAACGFRIPLSKVVVLSDLLSARDGQRLPFRLCIETETGEPVAWFVVALPRKELVGARFCSHLEPNAHAAAVAGWHADFAGDEAYAPRFLLRNACGEVRNLATYSAQDVLDAFPGVRAWRLAEAFDGLFTLRKRPLTLVVAHGADIVHEIPVNAPPLLFHASRVDDAVIGWAIDTVNPDMRPRVCARDAAGLTRSTKACVYRPDVRALVPGFDGFCGFLIPTHGMSGPFALELAATDGVVGTEIP